MSRPVVSDAILGCYLVTRPLERRPDWPAEWMPEQRAGAGDWLEWAFPGPWAISWVRYADDERERQAGFYGIGAGGAGELARVMDWATGAFEREFGWPTGFYGLEGARRARERFLGSCSDAALFGLGLPREFVGKFKAAGVSTVSTCLSLGEALAPSGEALGFDLLLTDSHVGPNEGIHSEFARKKGIQFNEHGLLGSIEEAERCRREMGLADAETHWWLPWLVVRYG